MEKAQRLAEKAMRLAPSDEVRRMRGRRNSDAIDLERRLLPSTFSRPPFCFPSRLLSLFNQNHLQLNNRSARSSASSDPSREERRNCQRQRGSSSGSSRWTFDGRRPPTKPLEQRQQRRFRRSTSSPAHPGAGRARLPRPLRRLRLLLRPGNNLLGDRDRGEEGVPKGGFTAAPRQVLGAALGRGVRRAVAGVRLPF